MAFVFGDNVRETVTITTPTATVPLGGAVPNSRAFSSVAANANTTWTVVRVGANLSAGEFTFNTGAPNTLTQTTVRYSTNGNAPVTFPSGPGEAFMDMPAYYALPLYFFGLGGNIWSVGINQGTNPVLSVDFNTASVATGVKVTGAAAAGGAAISVTSSGTNESLKIDAKGSGSITFNGTATGQLLAGLNGTAALPAWSFASDPDCGVYRIGANNLGISVNGAKVLDIATTGLGITGTLAVSAAAAGGSSTQMLLLDSGGSSLNGTVGEGQFIDFKGTSTVIGRLKTRGEAPAQYGWSFYSYNSGLVEAVKIHAAGGVEFGTPTGGDKGAGTLNAQAVYDDNVLLTCMALEFLNDGKIDTDYWDSMVPDRVIPAEVVPARIEEIPVMESVEIVDVFLDAIDGGYVARKGTKTVSRQAVTYAPIYDEDGNGIDAIEEPVFETKEIPEHILREETIEPRRHELAHTFKAMVDDGFDPRSPAAYIAKLKKDQALPGMPTKDEWDHGAHSVGEIHNRLWLATELLAMTVVALEGRITALEARR